MRRVLPNRDTEYLVKTVKCSCCYGRGRVAAEGYEFTAGTDPYERLYEQEQAVTEAESIIKKLGKEGDYG